MDTFQPSKAGRQAYIQRVLRQHQRANGTALGAGKAIGEASTLGADFIRHAIMVIGVVGLVGIAVAALTDAPLYFTILNWVTNWFA